jgi:FSR family fosmidomycin resistance protein-like MFS transporter
MHRDAQDRYSAFGQAALLGLAHALVDAASGYLLFSDLGRPVGAGLLLTYTAIAFGGQAPLGWVVDRLSRARLSAGAGVALVAAALLGAPWWPVAGLVAVGVGNALFHVGAGAQVLRRSGLRSADGGLFVGPGALGIFAGASLGLQEVDARAALVIMLAAALPLVTHRVTWSAPAPELTARPSVRTPALAVLAAAGLLASVTIRALAGGGANTYWHDRAPAMLLAIAAAACAGKVLGGFVSDRLGWSRASTLALVAAAPLLGPLLGSPPAAYAGVLLLQATMPVTLKATHLLLPDRPALAFGLPCLAILVGALLGKAPLPALATAPGVVGMLLLSAALVWLVLPLFDRLRADRAPTGRASVQAGLPSSPAG